MSGFITDLRRLAEPTAYDVDGNALTEGTEIESVRNPGIYGMVTDIISPTAVYVNDIYIVDASTIRAL